MNQKGSFFIMRKAEKKHVNWNKQYYLSTGCIQLWCDRETEGGKFRGILFIYAGGKQGFVPNWRLLVLKKILRITESEMVWILKDGL